MAFEDWCFGPLAERYPASENDPEECIIRSDDSEIDIVHPAGGHKPEFMDWRWEPLQNLPALIIPFKRPVYERVVKEFAAFARPA